MAKDDTQNSAPQSRVYKSNAVHKRRVGKTTPSRSGDIGVGTSAEVEPESDAAKDCEVERAEEIADHREASIDSPHEPLSEKAMKIADKSVNLPLTVTAVKPAEPSGEAANVNDFDEEGGSPEEPGDGSESLPEDGAAEEEDESARKKRRRTDPKTRAKRIVLAMLAVLVILAIGLASYYAWDRWGRYDDAADIQGQWYIDGTAAPIVIDAQAMQLADNVAYSYEIDSQEKTIRFSFGSWEGQGRYRFSDDRQRLLIMDGEYSGMGTLLDDLFTPFDAMVNAGAQQHTATLQEASGAASAASSDATSASAESAQESVQTIPSGQEDASSGQAGEQVKETQGFGQGVSLFNRQADPAALKAKEEAEKAAQAKAEREARAAAEAEAAEAAEYGYYDEYEHDESSDYVAEEEGADKGDQSDSDDEEGLA